MQEDLETIPHDYFSTQHRPGHGIFDDTLYRVFEQQYDKAIV